MLNVSLRDLKLSMGLDIFYSILNIGEFRYFYAVFNNCFN